jgi:hypothetical protein
MQEEEAAHELKIRFKYVVDGEWTFDQEQEVELDSMGYKNNVFDFAQAIIETPEENVIEKSHKETENKEVNEEETVEVEKQVEEEGISFTRLFVSASGAE